MGEKKRHHYVPVAYLKGFSDEDALVHAYPKDNPAKHLHLKPDEIGFERYYYSQPRPEGGRDNQRLENFFGKIEATWPPIVDRIRKRIDVNPDLSALLEFIVMMRVRVPAIRDLVELQLAEEVMSTARVLDRAGRLPPKPEGFEDILDHVAVAIDPHRSIHAMPILAQAFGIVLEQVGLRIVHNETDHDFITSDNPVVYFDPDTPETTMLPYTIDRTRLRVELLFPVDSRTIIIGRPEWRPEFSRVGIRHFALNDRPYAKRLNRLIARFGYRFLFGAKRQNPEFVKKYARNSPTLQVKVSKTEDGEGLFSQWVFGPRPAKLKWSTAK